MNSGAGAKNCKYGRQEWSIASSKIPSYFKLKRKNNEN